MIESAEPKEEEKTAELEAEELVKIVSEDLKAEVEEAEEEVEEEEEDEELAD